MNQYGRLTAVAINHGTIRLMCRCRCTTKERKKKETKGKETRKLRRQQNIVKRKYEARQRIKKNAKRNLPLSNLTKLEEAAKKTHLFGLAAEMYPEQRSTTWFSSPCLSGRKSNYNGHLDERFVPDSLFKLVTWWMMDRTPFSVAFFLFISSYFFFCLACERALR